MTQIWALHNLGMNFLLRALLSKALNKKFILQISNAQILVLPAPFDPIGDRL
jgi:hypothetical protein